MVSALVDAGADVGTRQKFQQTPLHALGRPRASGSGRCAEALIQKQADVDAVDSQGNSPLHLAASHGHVSS